MSFSPDWLALREPFDHRARSEPLGAAFAQHLVAHAPEGPLSLVELAGGLGSGIRWLQPRIPYPQAWTLVDHDPVLLDAVDPALATPLRHDLRALERLELQVHGVCCQALLDLVDHALLVALADWVSARRLPLLAALTVDGRVRWAPQDPEDEAVMSAFRLHQLGDRGFGASPGPWAAPILADLLRIRGHHVRLERADWRIAATDTEMIAQMIDGTAAAAAELHPRPGRVEAWRQRRYGALGRVALSVGHLDLLALPPGA
ncbi:MAG TPA: class I SAM-dependent methyltransferase [Deltaproteobacteria bacterium]|nr:class I SAM-dependent methyltransferase [Deltaproteobacteria bacterium]